MTSGLARAAAQTLVGPEEGQGRAGRKQEKEEVHTSLPRPAMHPIRRCFRLHRHRRVPLCRRTRSQFRQVEKKKKKRNALCLDVDDALPLALPPSHLLHPLLHHLLIVSQLVRSAQLHRPTLDRPLDRPLLELLRCPEVNVRVENGKRVLPPVLCCRGRGLEGAKVEFGGTARWGSHCRGRGWADAARVSRSACRGMCRMYKASSWKKALRAHEREWKRTRG